MKEWAIDPVTAGFIGSIALFGMMFGALIFGTIADKLEHLGVSRKKSLRSVLFYLACARYCAVFLKPPRNFPYFAFGRCRHWWCNAKRNCAG